MFKVWVDEEKKFVDTVHFANGIISYADNGLINWLKKKDVLVRSTNRRDQNGRMIYHGDIYVSSTEDGHQVFCVTWKDDLESEYYYPFFTEKWIADISEDSETYKNEDYYFDVIGNIFEHPHLLNKEYYEEI